jgi:hypothetical protein
MSTKIANNLYDELTIHNRDYDARKVMRTLVVLKSLWSNPEKEEKKQELMGELYLLLARTVLKSINGFFAYAKKNGIPEDKVLHSSADVASEFYIVLHTCVKNLKLQQRSSFAFFYNKALLRASVRLFDRNYKKHMVVVSNDGKEYLTENRSYNQHLVFNEIDLKRNFTEEEMLVIETKLSGEKLNDFLKRTKMPNVRYYEVLAVVKDKLQKLYNDDYQRIQTGNRTSEV